MPAHAGRGTAPVAALTKSRTGENEYFGYRRCRALETSSRFSRRFPLLDDERIIRHRSELPPRDVAVLVLIWRIDDHTAGQGQIMIVPIKVILKIGEHCFRTSWKTTRCKGSLSSHISKDDTVADPLISHDARAN